MAKKRMNKRGSYYALLELIDYIKALIQVKKGLKKYIIIGLLALAALVITLIIVKFTSGNETAPQESTSTESNYTIEDNPLIKGENPEIDELINKYFDARVSRDIDTINEIVESDNNSTLEALERVMSVIEYYENIESYVKKGLLDGTYIVFVSYETRFIEQKISAPSLSRFYIKTNDAGEVYISIKDKGADIETYIEKLLEGDDVAELVYETETNLKKALESDEDLAHFYEWISAHINESTEEETSGTADDNAGIEGTEEISGNTAGTEEVSTSAE
jgi:hypothetical protein